MYENIANATLYVPTGTLETYKAAPVWSSFYNIKEMNFSGIENIGTDTEGELHISVINGVLTVEGIDNCEIVHIYDMQGRLVRSSSSHVIDDLPRGIYILRSQRQSLKFAIQ